MVRLREIPRTATFAWSPGASSPLIATGTRAGAVDADFSNKTCLELWDLSLDRQDASEELQPIAKIDTDSGYAMMQLLSPHRYSRSTDADAFIGSMIWPGLSPRIRNEALSLVVWKMARWLYGTPISCSQEPGEFKL